MIPLVARASAHGDRPAVVAPDGRATYAELLDASARVASGLLGGAPDLGEARVAFLVPPGRAWIETAWGIWRAGGVAVPLATMHPEAELDYAIGDAGATRLVAHPETARALAPIAARRGLPLSTTVALRAAPPAALPAVGADRRGTIVYTSGTTSRPKGAVFTHRITAAQIEVLAVAWGWRADDRLLHVLPLHHLHGIVAALGGALWAGACTEFLDRFDAAAVWNRFAGSEPPTVFMGVPTMYARLVAAWDAAPAETRAAQAAAARRLRLMVSGSAALPVPLFERWRAITGHALLERYGTTEVGLVLSNPLAGPRRPGTVGGPLPGVAVRLVDASGAPVPDEAPGEIQVRGPTVFLEYWNRPEETAALRTADGWTRTGDIAIRDAGGRYRILGRASIDIIKSGGYKVSALEIEHALLAHEAIAECAVVGVPDPEWGEVVTAAVVLRPGASLTLDALRRWGRAHLAPYKLPRRLALVPALPRNALGKVTKPTLVAALAAGGAARPVDSR